MSADTNWIPASAVTVTIDDTPQAATDAKYSQTAGEWEATNLKSPRNSDGLIYYEGGNDVLTTKLSGTNVVDAAAAAPLRIGTKLPATWSATGEQTHSGTMRISSISKNGAPKGGFQVQWESTFTGEVVTS